MQLPVKITYRGLEKTDKIDNLLQLKEDSRLRRRAAESAGEGRGDVGSDDNLLGRFFRRHLLSGRRGGAWRRLQQTAMLDDFFDLRTVEGLVLKQRFGND